MTPSLPFSRVMRREQWTLGLVPQSAEGLVRHGLMSSVQWLSPPSEGFLADPCVCTLPDGRLRILAEALDYREFKGRIVSATVSRTDFTTATFQPVAQLPVHLSYPRLLPFQDRWLMFCESWEGNCIAVFSAPDTSGPWTIETRLLEGVPAVDPTPVEHQGRWYLFFTRQDDGPNHRLCLAHADTPLGPWQWHRRSIIVEDRGGARPAGPLFTLADGTLIRPGQDCRETYGGALSLYRINRLDSEGYDETFLRRIPPPAGPWPDGLHTLCPVDDSCCLIDGKRWQTSLRGLVHRPTRIVRTMMRRRRGWPSTLREEPHTKSPPGSALPLPSESLPYRRGYLNAYD